MAQMEVDDGTNGCDGYAACGCGWLMEKGKSRKDERLFEWSGSRSVPANGSPIRSSSSFSCHLKQTHITQFQNQRSYICYRWGCAGCYAIVAMSLICIFDMVAAATSKK
ncbi:uncharacterized protein LOC128259139 [Drosophila gunungcola]|uniref:Transmembrane protein n=1 Tax=Drosophila gunungcola TaxID=103775 RepID=A0A9P9YM67_9MUSC|nr:uncharacterized protein LOC128259139 [Drosophila gunungcola]KAI8039158.1 hypothetical protein M5D96_007875 [Drosophila gunungcola]